MSAFVGELTSPYWVTTTHWKNTTACLEHKKHKQGATKLLKPLNKWFLRTVKTIRFDAKFQNSGPVFDSKW